MKIFPVNVISGIALGSMTTASPTLGDNFLALVHGEARVVPDRVPDLPRALAHLLAPRVRQVAGLIHHMTAPEIPGNERWQSIHEALTTGLEPSPLSAPDPNDPTGLKYCEDLAGALMREAIEAVGRELAECAVWKYRIDEAVAGLSRASMEDILLRDFVPLPVELIQAPLSRPRRNQLLGYFGSRLEDLPEPERLKGIPLLAAVMIAAYRLKEPDLFQKGFELLEIIVQASTSPQETFRVLTEAIEMLREDESSRELAPLALIILKRFLLKMDPGDEKFRMLGEAARKASSLEDHPLALHLAQRRVDLAFVLIQDRPRKPPAERAAAYGALDDLGRPRKPSADATIEFTNFDDLRQLSLVFKDALSHLDPTSQDQLFAHARRVTKALVDDDLKRRVPLLLKGLSEGRPRRRS